MLTLTERRTFFSGIAGRFGLMSVKSAAQAANLPAVKKRGAESDRKTKK